MIAQDVKTTNKQSQQKDTVQLKGNAFHSFIHLVACLTKGPKPLPKRALHIVRSRASSFKWEYPLLSLRSTNSFLRLLPCLSVTSIPPCIFPSVNRCRRQFLRKMWPIQFAFRLRISCRIFLCCLTLSNTSSFLTWSVWKSYYLFTFSFLSKQTRHGRNIVSFYFFLFICGRAKCLSREQCVAALCSSCSLPKYLERWPAALYEARRSVLMWMKGTNIPRTELSTFHLYQHYSLFMHNKLL